MCNPLEKDVAILVVNTVSIRRVMNSVETARMVVRWDFMVTNVTKVGFVKIIFFSLRLYLYARCMLHTYEIHNNGSNFVLLQKQQLNCLLFKEY